MFVQCGGGYRGGAHDRCLCRPPRSVSRRYVLKCTAAASVVLGLSSAASVLIGPPQAPADPLSAAVMAPGQPVNIISRAQWGADESMRRGAPAYDKGVEGRHCHSLL